MTIEDQINLYRSQHGHNISINHYAFPSSYWGPAGPYTRGRIWNATHLMIEKASLEECLTSSSEYIREYKRWYESKKAKDADN